MNITLNIRRVILITLKTIKFILLFIKLAKAFAFLIYGVFPFYIPNVPFIYDFLLPDGVMSMAPWKSTLSRWWHYFRGEPEVEVDIVPLTRDEIINLMSQRSMDFYKWRDTMLWYREGNIKDSHYNNLPLPDYDPLMTEAEWNVNHPIPGEFDINRPANLESVPRELPMEDSHSSVPPVKWSPDEEGTSSNIMVKKKGKENDK